MKSQYKNVIIELDFVEREGKMQKIKMYLNKVQIIGANPRLAKILYKEKFSLYVTFKPSLQYVLKNYYQ